MPRTAPVPNIPAIPGMCPGVLIKAGGAGGGSSSGGRGKGKGAKRRAGTNQDEEGAEDGKKSANDCGVGANGSCTNCGSNISRGDPVDVQTGEVFTNPETDVRLPGFFDLEVTRSYSTSNRARDVGMGYGWTHSLAWSIEETRSRELIVTAGDGSVEVFPPLRPGQEAAAGPWGLLRSAEGFCLRPGTEFIHYFESLPGAPGRYRLVRVAYRDRGELRLEYERGCLARVIDTAGRVVQFESDSAGRIVRVFGREPNGAVLTFVALRYDVSGDLIAAVNADGYETQFHYDEHRLVRLRYPNAVEFHFLYDAAGRCIETWGDGATALQALDEGVTTVLSDGTTAKGIFHCRFEYTNDGYSEVVDSVRLQRFESAETALGKAVNARGGVTTREYDELGRPIALTDPTDATWVWQYDDMDEIVLVRGPEGDSIQVERDHLGRELQVFDAAGGATAIVRDVNGEIVGVRDQIGGEVNLRASVRGLPTDVLDERGGRHRLTYDGQGNCVERVFPNGATYHFEYDYWGRLTCTRNPDGSELRTAYAPSGKVLAETDALGRVTAFTYDAMGNLASRTDADGTTTRFEYGGMNWLTRVTFADGAYVQARYNREGWLVNFRNEAGEEAVRTYFPDGNLQTETQFHGRQVSLERDLLGRITAVDSGRNRHEFELSKTGRLVAHRVGEVTGTFQYDARGELVRAAYRDAEVDYERDAVGNVTRETFVIEGREYWVASCRNEAGDRSTLTTSLSHRVDCGRDANGRITQLAVGDRSALTIDRAVQGYVAKLRLPGGAEIVDERDEAHRLRRRHVSAYGGESTTHERRYAYTEVDELAAVHDAGSGRTEYTYDARHRITAKTGAQGEERFVVDATGNYSEVVDGRVLRQFGPGNQLLSRDDETYEYDAAGFLIAKTEVTDAGERLTWRFHWSARELLEAVDLPDERRVEFGYDYLARRVWKRVTRGGETLAHWHYVWDGMSLIHEVLLASTGEPSAIRTYLYEDSHDPMPLAHLDSGSREWVYYVEDVVGSPTALVDAEGRVLARISRSTFGMATVESTSGVTTAMRFPGQFEDTETGLHYNRYRYYDPRVGRYISPDPIGFWGGLNLYGYGPNPIGWTDPLGLVLAELVSAPSSFQNFATNNGNYNANAGGYSSGGVVSPGLNTGADGAHRNNGCGEQRFAQDLLAFGRTPAGRSLPRRKRRYRLEGKYPPCPTCHAALMRAAADTNSTVDYVWEQPDGVENRVSYRGNARGGCRVRGSGDAAERLTAGYDHSLSPHGGGSQQTTQGFYGVSFGGRSDETYAGLRAEQKAQR